jgi:ubiquinone/menaquinone biosynthesis C-methylase UbiE
LISPMLTLQNFPSSAVFAGLRSEASKRSLPVSAAHNAIVETYSQLARQYDRQENRCSCWGRASMAALSSLVLRDDYRVVADVGCGTGTALAALASRSSPNVQFIGLDPAPRMRERAIRQTRCHPNIRILDGQFEQMPLESGSVDYLYSILAFHWTSDLEASVREIARVLAARGEMDLFFIGRSNGREFIQSTTPIFLKYMGPALLLDSARMRRQISRQAAFELFSAVLGTERLSVEESYETYHDTLAGHWGWWTCIEGHFVQLPIRQKRLCYRAVKKALLELEREQGIPYTIHQLHVKLRNR